MTTSGEHSLCLTWRVAIGSLLLMQYPASSLHAAPPSKAVVGTFGTWDADVINVDSVSQTGAGVYVAVLDTGLVPNWRDYFSMANIATHLGTGFDQPVTFKPGNLDPCGVDVAVGRLHQTTWVGSTASTHGTHVVSTIAGYDYRSNADVAAGYSLPPIHVRGIAPGVTIIPVKVLSDYNIPALPHCGTGIPASKVTFGTSDMIAAGINYATDLALSGLRPMVVSMSFGGPTLEDVERAAIDRAIANGLIVVAAAGNSGESGMDFPGAYPPVISAGSMGWTAEWEIPGTSSFYRMWWLQYPFAPLLSGSGVVADPTRTDDLYVSDFSSRAILSLGQELDLLAPGSWVRGPFPGDPGFSHLPWWSSGIGDLKSGHGANFFFVGGTSMSTPHVSSVAALMLEKNPTLVQSQVESILKTSALPMPSSGSRSILDLTTPAVITWDQDCNGVACDPVGAGVLQADAALAATP